MSRRMRRTLPLLLLAALLMTMGAGPACAAAGGGLSAGEYDLEGLAEGRYEWETDLQLLEDYEPNVLLIKFRPPSDFPGREKQYQDAVSKVLGSGFEEIAEHTYLVAVDELSKNPNAVLNRFKNNRFVEYAEPNYIGSLDLTPNDPNYVLCGAVFAQNINAEAGWDIMTDSRVKVALVDTGYSGNNDLPQAGGYSVYRKNTDLTDLNGHGTQVAGTLGAVGCNDIKGAGVIWNANILPVKVSESSTVTVANVSAAILYAADHGAQVINLSLSFPSDSATLKHAVDYAFDKGCLLVAAVGNDGAGSVSYPAAYSNVLGVGGTTNGTSRYQLSNYGNGLDVLASWSWLTTTVRNTCGVAGGTSIAAPQVSGLAALLWELLPDYSNTQIMQLIRDNTNRGDGSWEFQTGYGVIDMGKALAAAQALGGGAPGNEVPSAAPQATPVPEPTEAPDVTAPVITLLGSAALELTEGDTYQEPGYTARDDRDGDVTGQVAVSGTVSTAYAGEYTLTYTVTDRAGNTGTAARSITVLPAPQPPEDVPGEPTITLNGSNPIILHLDGTPYTEQGASAFDELDGSLSAFVEISGQVDTSQPGTYPVTYSVTNSAGLTAQVTREVRVLAPRETVTRTPYGFSGQGKTGAHSAYRAPAEAEGEVELTVSGLNRMTLNVSIRDEEGNELFSEAFTGNGTRTFWAPAGNCTVETDIISAKGNGKFQLELLMPEVAVFEFDEEEVPLTGAPQTAGGNTLAVVSLVLNVLTLLGVGAILVAVKRRSKRS